MADVDAFLTKKVGGVKFVYVAAVGAVILALIAFNIWRKDKRLAKEVTTESAPLDASTDSGVTRKLPVSKGTVYPEIDPIDFAGGTTETALPTDFKGELSNEGWVTNATSYLVAQNKATPTTAQLALQHYLNGGNELSFTERTLVDAAIVGIGAPPIAPTLGKLPDAPTTASASAVTSDTTSVTSAPSAPYPGTFIRSGSTGGNVGRVQERLNAIMNAGLVVDQQFGPKTKAAVQAFQRAQGITVDGVVGPITWGRLFG